MPFFEKISRIFIIQNLKHFTVLENSKSFFLRNLFLKIKKKKSKNVKIFV